MAHTVTTSVSVTSETPSAPSVSRGRSTRGALHAPHIAIGHGELPTPLERTVRVPLAFLPDETWILLRRVSYRCAAFGNLLLNEAYVRAKNKDVTIPRTYTEYSEELSSAVRDAISQECVGIWRRMGKKVLRGEQTLGIFSAQRSIVIRDRGVSIGITTEGGQIGINVRVLPASKGELIGLPVWMPALKKDKYLLEILAKLVAGEWRISKGTIQFERPGRKVYIRLSYQRPAPVPDTSLVVPATVSYSEDEGLLIRCSGRVLSLNDRVHRLKEMRAHFSGIYARLRRDLGRRGRRHAHRQALMRAGSYERWAEGPVHQLSAEIIKWAVAQKAGTLIWQVKSDGELPWAKLKEQVHYKAKNIGMVLITRAETEGNPVTIEDGV